MRKREKEGKRGEKNRKQRKRENIALIKEHTGKHRTVTSVTRGQKRYIVAWCNDKQ